MPRNVVGRWAGGRICIGFHGRRQFIIERMVRGRRYPITLDVDSETQANAELALFLRDPAKYLAQAAAPPPALLSDLTPRIDAATLQRFLDHKRDSEERAPGYVRDLRNYLTGYGKLLDGRDLRTIAAVEHQALLRRVGGYRGRLTALKAFTGYLKAIEMTLKTSEDSTVDLHLPKISPRRKREEVAYSMATVETAYRNIHDQAVRDVVLLRAKFSMHHTEIDRLASGKGRVDQLDDHGEIAGRLRFPHKNRNDHAIAVDVQGLAAARRLQARGRAPDVKTIYKELAGACEAAKIPRVQPRNLRSSYATWCASQGRVVKPAEGLGVAPEIIAATMGHLSKRTTERFYIDMKCPPMIALPLKLFHPEDPKPLVVKVKIVAS